MVIHKPVLLKESIENLDVKKTGTYVDCTFGSGGHSKEIISKLSNEGTLISLDCDQDVVDYTHDFRDFKNFTFVRDNFSNIKNVLEKLNLDKADGFIFDLGLSSMQIESLRGFSYRKESSFLDMRMDNSTNLTAYEIVNKFSEKELADVFFYLGEDFSSRKIASYLCKARKRKKIEFVGDLVSIIISSLNTKKRKKKHPAKKVFQALRMKANDEIENLENSIIDAINLLSKKGSVVVISYHSLEDRIIKNLFKKFSNERDFVTFKKPIMPSFEEIKNNNRARSAKLRVIHRL